MNMKRTFSLSLASAAIGAAGLLGFGEAGASLAAPQQNGLVNVALVDTTVQVPLTVAANICDVNVNVLAQQLDLGPTACGAGATATAVDSGGSGGGNGSQSGLVNIYAEDTTIQVPVSVAANLCDVAVNVIARHHGQGGTTCTAIGNSGAGG